MNAAAPKPVQSPPDRPRMTRADVVGLVAKEHPQAALPSVFLVGVRGYYRDTLGAPGVNDRGIYDDALFLVVPAAMQAFNANVDPSRVRKGSGKGAAKGMARLKPGLYRAHRLGKHKGQYDALIQTAGPVTVIRDGVAGDYEDTGYFGINIHRGGVTTTSSEGCQTIPPPQYGAFMVAVTGAMRAAGQDVLPYILIGGDE